MAAINRQRKRLLLRMHSKVLRHNIVRGFMDVIFSENAPLQPGDTLFQNENVTVAVNKINGDRVDLTATITQTFKSIYATFKIDEEGNET